MASGHVVHTAFQQLSDGELRVTLNWDHPLGAICDANDASQELKLFKTAMGSISEFYNECKQAWEKKKHTRGPSPWPHGVVTPPLCHSVGAFKFEKRVQHMALYMTLC